MNSTNTNVGGWPASEMRTYVNSDIYNVLPEVLRNAIINTRVVSGHGSVDTTNYTTTDKLYLLSRREVWNYIGEYDTASEQTRQLDYYESQNVTTSSYAGAIKQRNGSGYIWWLRLAGSDTANYFKSVASTGSATNSIASDTGGVSPAFRLG